MSIQEQDKQFMIECLTKDLVMMLMEDYGYSMEKALSIVYNSKTGLYYQSAEYAYDFLNQELNQCVK